MMPHTPRARGILLGLVLSLTMWALAALVWWLLR
jgi:hypothetical protein